MSALEDHEAKAGASEPETGAIAPEMREDAEETATNLREWLGGAPLPKQWHAVLGLFLPMLFLVLNMRSIRAFTIDDAYISYRYARNFSRGLGLVYNEGERIEGYTNFLWTVVLGAGIRVGLDPDAMAKIMGGTAACGTLYMVYRLAQRFRPFRTVPCIATWLLASSFPTAGYAVFGLETSMFVFLVLAGIVLMFDERDEGPSAFPYSGFVFGLAGLTRPEAPMFVGIPMLCLGLGFVWRLLFRRRDIVVGVYTSWQQCVGLLGKQNIIRGLIFAAALAGYMSWRRSYYGHWLPNTLDAKTGNLAGQMQSGAKYITDYWNYGGPFLWFVVGGLSIALVVRRREVLATSLLAFASLAYITLVGGDWMPYFRFAAPFEPFGFLLVDLAIRTIIEARHRAANMALAAFAVFTIYHRASAFDVARKKILFDEKRFWDSAAGAAANWFKQNGKRGEIAVADIGYVGYATDFPVFDLLGLVDPVISKLPGGYTQKTGPGYVAHVFNKKPRYFLFVGGKNDCERLPFPAQSKLRNDARFRRDYIVAGKVRHAKDGFWCIYERKEDAAP